MHCGEACRVLLKLYIVKSSELSWLPFLPKTLLTTRSPTFSRMAVASPVEIWVEFSNGGLPFCVSTLDITSLDPWVWVRTNASSIHFWVVGRTVGVSRAFLPLQLSLLDTLFLLLRPLEHRPESLIHPFLHNFSIPSWYTNSEIKAYSNSHRSL